MTQNDAYSSRTLSVETTGDNMSKTIVEIATIRLKSGVTEQQLIETSDSFQSFLDGVDGFLRRELLKQGDAGYADLVHWRDQAAADAMMALASTSPECLAYFELMDMDGMDPAEGVQHFASVAAYGPT
jgi:DNA polymerase III epsilon subunit-like protein